jgi:hypothetical protein
MLDTTPCETHDSWLVFEQLTSPEKSADDKQSACDVLGTRDLLEHTGNAAVEQKPIFPIGPLGAVHFNRDKSPADISVCFDDWANGCSLRTFLAYHYVAY